MKLATLTSATISILRAQTTINITFLYPVAVHVDVGPVEPSPVVNISRVNPTVCPGEGGLVETAGKYEEPHGDSALHSGPHRHNWGAQSQLPSSSPPITLNYNSMSITQLDYICCSPFPHNIFIYCTSSATYKTINYFYYYLQYH